MKRFLPLIALAAFVTVYANQQRVKISPGFFTGKDYLDMSDTEKRAYTTGEINGMLVAPLYLVLLMIAFPLVLYLPTHFLLKRLFN